MPQPMSVDKSMLNISRLFLIPIPHAYPKSIAVAKCIICVVSNLCCTTVDICYIAKQVFDKVANYVIVGKALYTLANTCTPLAFTQFAQSLQARIVPQRN